MKSKYKSIEELPLSLNAEDIAGVLGISRAGAYTLIKKKDFPKIIIGSRYIIPRDRFLEWINLNITGGEKPYRI